VLGGCWCTDADVRLRSCCLNNPACATPPCWDLKTLWLNQIFRHYIINGTIFGKTLLNVKCVFVFPLQFLFKNVLILRRILRYIFINVKTYLCKVSFSLVRFESKLNFLDRLSKEPQMSYFIKIRLVGAELFHAERLKNGRTYKHNESNSTFSQFCEGAYKIIENLQGKPHI
jgi:hypothetical protein